MLCETSSRLEGREGGEDLLYVPGYLNRLIDPLLKRRVPLSISETARHQSAMCYQTGESIKSDGKTEGGRGDGGTGSELSADWFSPREVGFRGLAALATDSQESAAQRWNIHTGLCNLAGYQLAQSHRRIKSAEPRQADG